MPQQSRLLLVLPARLCEQPVELSHSFFGYFYSFEGCFFYFYVLEAWYGLFKWLRRSYGILWLQANERSLDGLIYTSLSPTPLKFSHNLCKFYSNSLDVSLWTSDLKVIFINLNFRRGDSMDSYLLINRIYEYGTALFDALVIWVMN